MPYGTRELRRNSYFPPDGRPAWAPPPVAHTRRQSAKKSGATRRITTES